MANSIDTVSAEIVRQIAKDMDMEALKKKIAPKMEAAIIMSVEQAIKLALKPTPYGENVVERAVERVFESKEVRAKFDGIMYAALGVKPEPKPVKK